MFRIIADKKPQSILMERNTDGTYKITYKGVAIYSSVGNKMFSDVTVIIYRASLSTEDISIDTDGTVEKSFCSWLEWALPEYGIKQIYPDLVTNAVIEIIEEFN